MRGAILSILLLCGFAYQAQAEQILLLKAIQAEPPNTLKGVPRPKKGMI